ncbi:DUF3862 domain-containing protein [Caminicella sporogenes]|uniref:DUF3862 domain-containing protein n=1 Tax=Caminicella sporogenes TaxID=166485 RepID=UPI002541E588|nr:DUF3862 domain-containing protein [Caminicella sporogenes]WIF95022.1 DUF3862 domain-containing protein [Caminicella sporogenes]
MKKIILSILLVSIIVFTLAGCSSSKVNMEMYNKIQNGMTYEEVVNILGEGEEVSSSEVAGIKTAIYQWVNNDGSNMNVTIQDGKVISKAQYGLK